MLIKNIQPSRIELFYDVVLVEKDGEKALNISVGKPEAESMAIFIDNIKTPRPLTYDVFCNIMQEYSLLLREVVLTKFLDGNYYAEASFVDCDGNSKRFDMRPSDALNAALRYSAPIYALDSLINEAGFNYADYFDNIIQESFEQDNYSKEKLSDFGLNVLKDLLRDALEKEDYKCASMLRDRINAIRKNSKKEDKE